jgi:hypothetical protein
MRHEVMAGKAVVLCCTAVSEIAENADKKQLTWSHWSMPRLVFFPPFWISLSFPTDTALNAKNCRRR